MLRGSIPKDVYEGCLALSLSQAVVWPATPASSPVLFSGLFPVPYVDLKPRPQQAAELSVCTVEDSGSQFYGARDDCQTVSHLTELPAQCRRLQRLVPRVGSPHSLVSSSVLCFTLYRWLLYLHPT